jgi:hypothetical protein
VLGAGVVTFESGASGDFWELAQQAKKDLAYFREPEREFMISSLLGQVSASSEQTIRLTADQLGYELILTSPGLIDLDLASSKLVVQKLWGPSVLMGFAQEQSVSALTYQGCLYLTHTSFAPIHGLLAAAVHQFLDASSIVAGPELEVV